MRLGFIQYLATMPLRRQITMFVLISTLLLLITILGFYYSFYFAALNTSYEYMDTTLQNTENHIDALLDDISSSMLTLAYSQDVYDEFINVPDVRKFETGGVIRTMLNSLTDSDLVIDGIVIRLKQGQTLQSTNISGTAGLYQVFDTIVNDYELSQPFTDVILTRCYAQPDTDNQYFACLVPIYNTTGGKRSADRYVGAYIALCAVKNMVDTHSYGVSPTKPTIVISNKDSVIYSNDNALAPGLVQAVSRNNGEGGPVKAGGTVYQTRVGTVKDTNWDILCAVSDTELRSGLNQIYVWGIILTLSVVLVQLLMGYTLRRRIVRPLSSIVKQIHSVGNEVGPASMTIPDSSEIGILAVDIKDMLNRIDQMNAHIMDATKALYKVENNRLAAQIMFLQAQINPHFLYNNLECIRGMAAGGHMEGVRRMTTDMAVVYRYCVSAGQTATLDQELSIARKFVEMISLRYNNRFSIDFSVAENMLARPIPKMTLQPILENIFLHGFAGIKYKGAVMVEGSIGPDGETILSISDNGHGMDAQKINDLNRSLFEMTDNFDSETNNIGIINVNRRIYLLFGNEYGVTLEPNTPRGLRVIIKLGEHTKLVASYTQYKYKGADA